MSQEDVELVRGVFDAGSAGDPSVVEAAFDPMAEWDMSGVAGWAEKEVYRGAGEILQFLEAWASSWEGWHYDVDEVLHAGEGKVFVAIHEWATGVESDVSVDQRRYFAVEVAGERIVRVRMFSERTDGVHAAGLE